MQSKFIKEINKMETLNYKVLEGTGYNGYILKDAPVKVMQFGEGNFLRAFVDYFYDIANEKAGYNGKVKLVQPIGNFPGIGIVALSTFCNFVQAWYKFALFH